MSEERGERNSSIVKRRGLQSLREVRRLDHGAFIERRGGIEAVDHGVDWIHRPFGTLGNLMNVLDHDGVTELFEGVLELLPPKNKEFEMLT